MSAPVQPEPWHAPFSKPPAPWYAPFLNAAHTLYEGSGLAGADRAIRKTPGIGPTLDKAGADLDHTFSSKQAFTEAMKGFLTPGETPLMGAVGGPGTVQVMKLVNEMGLGDELKRRAAASAYSALRTMSHENAAVPRAATVENIARDLVHEHTAMHLHAALEKDGGFSFDPRAAQFVKHGGVMVGGVPGQQGMVVNKVTPGVLKEFAKKNADLLAQDGMMMGGWRDADGKIYLDVSQKVSHAEAPALLKARGEKAGWDLDAGAEVVNPHANGAVSAGSESHPDAIGQELRQRHPGVDISVSQEPDRLVLNRVFIPKSERGTGRGTAAMRDLLKIADERGLPISTTPDGSEEGTSTRRLEGFLRRFGFGPHGRPDTEIAEPWMRPVPEKKADLPSQQSDLFNAPAVITRQGWKPTERGVFDRSAPANQGTTPVDPRMNASMPRGGVSPLIEAIGESPTVERGLLADTEAGLPMGGHSWYETGPVKASFEGKGPLTFDDWVNAGGSGSIQNPTHNEPASASILLYAKKHGISVEEAMAEFERRFPRAATPWMSKGIASNFRRADEAGLQLPSDPGAGERKVPWYSHGKQGGSLEGHPALDTHERRRLLQLGLEDPSILRKLTNAGLHKDPMGVIPITNALEYEALGRPYQRIAHNLGLPSTQAAQAGRWLGGGHHTGLASQPFGDYVQTLEDGLLYTARTRGLDESPKALRSLWDAISQGEDFFMPLYSRKGGYPVY